VTARSALFAAVLNEPADDTARLVLADWLEEHAEEPFGRFVRAGVVAGRYSETELIDDPDYYAALRTIAGVASAGAPAAWLAALGLGSGPPPLRGEWGWDNAGDRVAVRVGAAVGVFRRGLLAEVDVTLAEWVAGAERALAGWPIELVRATDVPGLCFRVDRRPDGWRLSARVKLPGRNVPLTGLAMPSAMAPTVVLAHSSAELAADQLFPTRDELVANAARECAALADELKAEAGDRWPRPRRRR
jgi:uncharacterized protein (TIGR02996 family)